MADRRASRRTSVNPDVERHFEDKPEGPISAAIIAAGIGALGLGVLTTLAEASETFSGWLTLNAGVGALSGKTIWPLESGSSRGACCTPRCGTRLTRRVVRSPS
jgi:hypothetical protein